MAKAPKSPKQTHVGEGNDSSFEQLIEKLETIVSQLESEDVALDKAVALFEEGMRLSKLGEDKLDAAERRVEVLLQRGDKVITKTFEEGPADP